jgi:hypothetical protein
MVDNKSHSGIFRVQLLFIQVFADTVHSLNVNPTDIMFMYIVRVQEIIAPLCNRVGEEKGRWLSMGSIDKTLPLGSPDSYKSNVGENG